MKQVNGKFAVAAIGAIAGGIIGAILVLSLTDQATSDSSQATASAEKAPLYWVAPMDPKYTSDKPGKSPMGMDLIPVYADAAGDGDSGPGTVRISPEVVNNLGVRTAKATRAPLHTMIRTVGYVQYDQDRLVHIHPRVEGWVEKLYVKAAGDPVEKDQALYDLYSPALVNAQEELLLALNRKNQRLIQAARDRLAALNLSEKIIGDLEKSGQVRQTITFFAPQTGVVDNLNIREGFFVQPGTTMMSIGVLDDVWVEAEVFERQAAQVKPGMPVTMTLDYLPGREWQGKLDYIYPSLDEKTRTLRVRLRFDNFDKALRPNMFVQLVMHADDQVDTLLVPREAVIRTGSQQRVVLALGDGRFKSVEVKVGRIDEGSAEILDGISPGDLVVTSAQFLLDSESSKTSDFNRMQNPDTTPPTSVWTQAEIRSLMPQHRMVTVSHAAIPEWGWPAMAMDFTVAEEVDFQALHEGLALHLELTRRSDSQYLITNIRLNDGTESDVNHGKEHSHD